MLLLLLVLLVSLIPPAPTQPVVQPAVDQTIPIAEMQPVLGTDTRSLVAPASSDPLVVTRMDVPTTSDPRRLPPDLARLPELIDRRTANSATFQHDDGTFTTLIALAPIHYRDAVGFWQIINPVFTGRSDSFVVEHNSLRMRTGQRDASVVMVAEQSMVGWRATTLSAVQADDSVTPLATAQAESPNFAEQRADGYTLHYTGGWTDPELAEELISGPGSIEHLLVLNAPPSAAGDPEFLELRATLKLLRGETLWAEGQPQTEAFETAGALEVHTQADEVALVLDPVRAFEQEQSGVSVAGVYTAQPGAQKGEWIIGLRTPWRWWVDPGRRYPAVIDPTMHVLRTTSDGSNGGMAWVENGAGHSKPSTAFHTGKVVLANWGGDDSYAGYMQFNRMPALLMNQPVQITEAMLDITPGYDFFPSYHYTCDDECSPSWKSLDIVRAAQLYNLGLCTDEAPDPCDGFSLIDDRVLDPNSFHWGKRPLGTLLGTKMLTVGPAKKGGGRCAHAL